MFSNLATHFHYFLITVWKFVEHSTISSRILDFYDNIDVKFEASFQKLPFEREKYNLIVEKFINTRQ